MSEIGNQSPLASHEILILFENRLLSEDGATVKADSQAGEGSNLIADNLLSPALDLHWRSGSVKDLAAAGSNAVVRWTLGGPRAVDTVILGRHNLRLAYRVRLFKEAASTGQVPLFESPWTDPVVRASPADFPTFSAMPFSLGPKVKELDTWQDEKRLCSALFTDRRYDDVRAIEIEIDSSGAPNGSNSGYDYLQIGGPMAGLSFRPFINMPTGWEIGLRDRAETIRTESGALDGRKRSIARVMKFTLDYLERSEAFSRILTDWARSRGKLGRVFVWAEPAQRRYFYDQAMIATLTSLPAVAMANLEWPAAKGFRLEETE